MPIVRNTEALSNENLIRIFSYSVDNYNIEIDGEFIKDEDDKRKKTEPLFFQVDPCPNKYGFSLKTANGMVVLSAAVDTHSFAKGAKGGENTRRQAIASLKKALKNKGVAITEDGNDSVISFSREQLKTNDFLKTTPMGEVDVFLGKIKTNAAAKKKLAEDILAIANDLDSHIDTSKDIDKIRAYRKTQFEEGDGKKGSTALPKGYEKSVYTYPKQNGGDEGYPAGVIQRKRVKIPDSPFWISIGVVNGEFVIATQEDRMYLGNTSQQMEDLRDALEKNAVFKKVFDAAKKPDSDMVFGRDRIYFAQNAFNELKKNKEAAIEEVDKASADQEEAKSNKLIVDRFSFYKTKAELKAARILGSGAIPHTLITAANLQFLPCEDADRFQMTIVNENNKILQSSPKETYVKLEGDFAEKLRPKTKNPSGAFQPYGARFEWMHFKEIDGGQKIFGTAYLLNAKFNNCVFDGVDFSQIPEAARNSISFKGCVFTNCKPEGIENCNKNIKDTGLKAEVEEVRRIVNAITDPDAIWKKAQENLDAVREERKARKTEVPKTKVSTARHESVGVELTSLVDKLNELRGKHKAR